MIKFDFFVPDECLEIFLHLTIIADVDDDVLGGYVHGDGNIADIVDWNVGWCGLTVAADIFLWIVVVEICEPLIVEYLTEMCQRADTRTMRKMSLKYL